MQIFDSYLESETLLLDFSLDGQRKVISIGLQLSRADACVTDGQLAYLLWTIQSITRFYSWSWRVPDIVEKVSLTHGMLTEYVLLWKNTPKRDSPEGLQLQLIEHCLSWEDLLLCRAYAEGIVQSSGNEVDSTAVVRHGLELETRAAAFQSFELLVAIDAMKLSLLRVIKSSKCDLNAMTVNLDGGDTEKVVHANIAGLTNKFECSLVARPEIAQLRSQLSNELRIERIGLIDDRPSASIYREVIAYADL